MLRHSAYGRIQRLADLTTHQISAVQIHDFALDRHRATLARARLRGLALEALAEPPDRDTFPACDCTYDAVHGQIRVTTDGRGEMGVMFYGESEMADIVDFVAR